MVRLVHFSVKEYLLSDRSILRSEFNAYECYRKIAEGCLRYLPDIGKDDSSIKEASREFPLSKYSAKYWWQHAQQMNGLSCTLVLDLTLDFLTTKSETLSCWQGIYSPKPTGDLNFRSRDIQPPLCAAAGLGFARCCLCVIGVGSRSER